MSLRKAWPPRPAAKNAYRQLSWMRSAGSISPSARNACQHVPGVSAATASTQALRSQADDSGSPAGACDCAPPCLHVRAAKPDHQRIGSKCARRGEGESIRHVGEAEGTELLSPQHAGDAESDSQVGQARQPLVGDTPAEMAGSPAPQRTEKTATRNLIQVCRLCGQPLQLTWWRPLIDAPSRAGRPAWRPQRQGRACRGRRRRRRFR